MIRNQAIMLIMIGLLCLPLSVKAQQKIPDVSFQTVNNKEIQLSHFRGKKVMLWILSTWCPSCKAGLKALEIKKQVLNSHNLQVIILRNYNNGGYPGPPIQKFVENTIGKTGDGIVLGQAGHELARKLNPRNYPDIYYLVDPNGNVNTVSSSPNATMSKILQFVHQK